MLNNLYWHRKLLKSVIELIVHTCNLCFDRHYFEANQNMQKYHQLFQISQEKYDRLANLAGSGGAVGLKDSDVIDPSLVEVEFTRALQSESLSSGGKGDKSNLKVFIMILFFMHTFIRV